MMLANILIKYFEAGGPIMWPILIAGLVAVAVVGERTFWWFRESMKRDPQALEKLFAALEAGDFPAAAAASNFFGDFTNQPAGMDPFRQIRGHSNEEQNLFLFIRS